MLALAFALAAVVVGCPRRDPSEPPPLWPGQPALERLCTERGICL